MRDDPIMDMVNNVESMYNDKNAMYDKWVKEGDVWSEHSARRQALAMAEHFAEAIQSAEDRYSSNEIRQAADKMMEEFEEYREEAIKEAVTQAQRIAKPEDLVMDAGDIEHAEKYEAVAQKIGIDFLKNLIPASPDRVRTVLERGDKHLNTIPLRKWDAAANAIRMPGLSLSEKVCALKHVAKWHYA